MEALERIAARTGTTVEDVKGLAAEFGDISIVPVLNYLEQRLASMRGDENPKYELEQISRDLGALTIENIVNG